MHNLLSYRYLKFILSTWLGLLIHATSEGQSLTRLPISNFEKLSNAQAEWADFNNDGYSDLFVSGNNGSGAFRVQVYYNNGDSTFNSTNLANLGDVAFDLGDYNNDGLVDILLSGKDAMDNKSLVIFENNGSSFSAQVTGITGLSSGGLLWEDLDADGDLDIVATGLDASGDRQTIIAALNETSYQTITHNLTALSQGEIKAFDANNDGLTEVLMTGINNSGDPEATIYTFDHNLGISIYTSSLEGSLLNSISTGDYNEDGFVDFILTGTVGNSLNDSSVLYMNNQVSGFTQVSSFMTALSQSSADFGDLNNDGLIDIILTGIDQGSMKFLNYYLNSPTYSFTDSILGLEPIFDGDVALGDLENDGDLDLFQIGKSDTPLEANLYASHVSDFNTNNPPGSPTGLKSLVKGDTVTFSWTKPTDDLTDQNSLTYNIYVSSSTNGNDLYISPAANISTGKRHLFRIGNTGFNSMATYHGLPEGRYYWSVQALDNNHQGSLFSTEESFSICDAISLGADTAICHGESISYSIGSGTDSVNWYSLTTGLLLADSFDYTFSGLAKDTIIAELITDYHCVQTDTVIIDILPLPIFSLGQDTAICLNESIAVAGIGLDSVNWYSLRLGQLLTDNNTYNHVGEQNDTIVAEGYDLNGCTSSDTIIINILALPEFSLGEDTTLCLFSSLDLSVSGLSTVNWFSTTEGLIRADNDSINYRITGIDTLVAQGIDTNGCRGNDSIAVNFHDLPVLDLGADTSICFNETVTLEVNGFDSVNWFTNISGLVTPNDNRTDIRVIESTNVITEVFNIQGCVSYDSILLEVIALPEFNIGADTAICHGNNLLLSTAPSLKRVDWQSLSSDDTIQADRWFLDYAALTTDTVIAIGISNFNCVNYDTITIEVLPLPVFSLGPDLTICEGDTVGLSVSGYDSINWFTENNLSILLDSANLSFVMDDDIELWAEVFDHEGCVRNDTIMVSALVLPAFDLGEDQVYCHGDSIIIETGVETATYLWADSIGTVLSNTAKYMTVADRSTQIITTLISEESCVFTDTLSVIVNALPMFTINGVKTICQGASTTLNVSYMNPSSVSWSLDGQPSASVGESIDLTPQATTEISAELTDQHGCQSTVSADVIVNNNPPVDAGKDTLICAGTSLMLGSLTFDVQTGTSYVWEPAEFVSSSSQYNTEATPETSTLFRLTATDSNACSSSDSVEVLVSNMLIPDAGEDLDLCIGDSITLRVAIPDLPFNQPVTYQWDPSETLIGMNTSAPTAFPRVTTQYIITTTLGECDSERDTILVNVNPLPTLEITPSVSLGVGQSIALEVTEGVQYKWFPTETLDDETIRNPVASPQKTETYVVQVTDIQGCTNTASVKVFVQNSIFIPSMFSPNGDGSNDTFFVFGSGVSAIRLSVFTQSGKEVFSSTDPRVIFDENLGWDGKFNGKALADDTYIWNISGTFADGSPLTFEGRNSGIVRLVR